MRAKRLSFTKQMHRFEQGRLSDAIFSADNSNPVAEFPMAFVQITQGEQGERTDHLEITLSLKCREAPGRGTCP